MSRIDYDGAGELHVTDIDEARRIEKTPFDRVITVCQDPIADNVPDTIEYSQYNMSDGSPQERYGGSCEYELFAAAATELREALSNDETVLIHCHMGISRSVSVSVAALGRLLGLQRSEALDLVHRYRPVNQYPDRLLLEHAQEYIHEC